MWACGFLPSGWPTYLTPVTQGLPGFPLLQDAFLPWLLGSSPCPRIRAPLLSWVLLLVQVCPWVIPAPTPRWPAP